MPVSDQALRELKAAAQLRQIMATRDTNESTRRRHKHVARLLRAAVIELERETVSQGRAAGVGCGGASTSSR